MKKLNLNPGFFVQKLKPQGGQPVPNAPIILRTNQLKDGSPPKDKGKK